MHTRRCECVCALSKSEDEHQLQTRLLTRNGARDGADDKDGADDDVVHDRGPKKVQIFQHLVRRMGRDEGVRLRSRCG